MPEALSLKEDIIARAPLLGPSITSMAPPIAEVAVLCGCDFVWIEVEHATIDMMQIEHMCRAVELRGALSLLRVQDGSRTAVLRALEAGARIVVTPQIHTPQQAAAVAEFGKFPPLGERGYNTGSRGMMYGFSAETPDEAFARANRETCLLVQIESAQAVDNAEGIMGVDGIDGVLVGPGDLSASMRVPSRWDDPGLIAAIEGVFALAHRHGKITATTCPTADMIRRWGAAGVHILAIGGELGMLRQAMTERLAEVRGLLGRGG